MLGINVTTIPHCMCSFLPFVMFLKWLAFHSGLHIVAHIVLWLCFVSMMWAFSVWKLHCIQAAWIPMHSLSKLCLHLVWGTVAANGADKLEHTNRKPLCSTLKMVMVLSIEQVAWTYAPTACTRRWHVAMTLAVSSPKWQVKQIVNFAWWGVNMKSEMHLLVWENKLAMSEGWHMHTGSYLRVLAAHIFFL